MKLLDLIESNDECEKDSSCPETSGAVFSYIALMIYMVLANLLL